MAIARRRKQRGMSLALMLVFLMGFVVIGSMALTTSMTTDKFGERQKELLQATNLAETAVQAMYDAVRNEMRVSGTYPFAINSTDVTTNDGGAARVVGSYQARVVNMAASQEDVGPDNNRQRVTTYTFIIEGTGRTNSNISQTMRAKFVGLIQRELVRRENVVQTGPSLGMIYIPKGAIASNGLISANTGGGVQITSPDGFSGHVISNQGIEWRPVSGNKNAVTGMMIDAQGQFVVHSSAYDFTIGANGLGNANGTRNYRSPAINGRPGWPDLPASSVVQANRPINFASAAEVDGWVNDWRTVVAQPTANRFMSNLRSTDVVPVAGERVIETPAYIDGDLTIQNGDTLRLKPMSSNPRQNVVYVRGRVRNLGTLKNLGVKVVVEGGFEGVSPSTYEVDNAGSSFGTMGRVLQNAALITTNVDRRAIDMPIDGSVTTGLLYSTKGGIEIAGRDGAAMTGAMVAGGGGSDGGVSIRTPSSGATFTLNYAMETGIPADYDPNWERRIDVNYVEGGTTQWFTPGKLMNWVIRH